MVLVEQKTLFKNKNYTQKMDYRKVESERATNGVEHEDEYVHRIFIAAGTLTLAMACLKRILVMFFAEQWRARVFLILNLVLLAIVYTSMYSSSSRSENQESNDNAEIKTQENKKPSKECAFTTEAKHHKACQKSREANELVQEHIKIDSEAHKLSKEELNEKVEAFIAMFRQHLVSDARKGRNQFIPRSKQSEMFNSHNLTTSSERVKLRSMVMKV